MQKWNKKYLIKQGIYAWKLLTVFDFILSNPTLEVTHMIVQFTLIDINWLV